MVVFVSARREMVTNVELCLLTPILPIVAALEANRKKTAVLCLSVLQTGCLTVALVMAWYQGQTSLAWTLVASGAALGAMSGGVLAGGHVGPVAFGLSRASIFQFGLLLPFWHWRYLSDLRVAGVTAILLLTNAVFCVWYLLILPNIERMHAAWGCYPHATKLKRYDLGMCGFNEPWNPPISPICLQLAGDTAGVYGCEPVHASVLSLHGPNAVTAAHYVTIGSLFLYVAACQRQYAIDVTHATAGSASTIKPDRGGTASKGAITALF